MKIYSLTLWSSENQIELRQLCSHWSLQERMCLLPLEAPKTPLDFLAPGPFFASFIPLFPALLFYLFLCLSHHIAFFFFLTLLLSFYKHFCYWLLRGYSDNSGSSPRTAISSFIPLHFPFTTNTHTHTKDWHVDILGRELLFNSHHQNMVIFLMCSILHCTYSTKYRIWKRERQRHIQRENIKVERELFE